MSPARIAGLAAVLASLVLAAPAPAASVIAAYDHYVSGKGFEIGLVNASTGTAIALPPGVNTTADELHPALSSDGRFLWFARATVQPTLSGSVPPPTARSLVRVDRTTAEVTVITNDSEGFGATFTNFGNPILTVGLRPLQSQANQTNFIHARARAIDTATGAYGAASAGRSIEHPLIASGAVVEVTHATTEKRSGTFGKETVAGAAFTADGVPTAARVRIDGPDRNPAFLGTGDLFATHPSVRPDDGHVAFTFTEDGDSVIHSFTYGGGTPVAVAPIRTGASEDMPAWTPDLGKQLGFVRTTGDRRALGLFDTTPGIQTALNTPTDIGAVAPTPGLRAFHGLFGGLSLAISNTTSIPTVQCRVTCVKTTSGATQLQPFLTSASAGQTVGIFVARVNGTRTLLGRKVPRIAPVGRVPLGAIDKGRNRFAWNGKVEGRALAPGRYLLTFRALAGDRVLNTSESVRFRVSQRGALGGFRPLD